MLRVRTVLTGPMVVGSGVNTLYFAGTGQASAINAASAAQTFWGGVDDRQLTGSGWDVVDTVDEIAEATGDLIASYAVTGGLGSGVLTDDALPPATQGLIRLNTAGIVANRRVVGRIFIPSLGEAQSTNGAPIAAFISAMNTVVNAMIVGTPDLVVWARPFTPPPGDPRPPRAGSAHSVTSGVCSSKWAVLRSRRD